ncbi:MAG: PAS domain-containing protein [Nitrospiraceae bacterium]|nr:MAG: PAS domain-containing protein [Nitrospiraceae bacterium]
MPDKKNRILFIEDHRAGQMALKAAIEDPGIICDCLSADSFSEAREILGTQKFDLVITDYLLDDGSAFDILDTTPDTPVIVIAESSDAGIAIKAMKAGAYDYLIKDREFNYLKVLPMTIENALKRKKYEERIRLLESAVVNANDAIIILEAEPGVSRGRRILYVNDAFIRMTGYTFEESAGNTLRMLRGPKTDLAVLDNIRNALNGSRPIRVELVNCRKDGTEFWAECNIVPFANEKGEFIHWVSVQRDITERKKAEEEREKLMREIESINSNLTELNQELETIGAERTMSLMALTVADRIRNPAAMIGARCRRILTKQELPEELRGAIGSIIEEADKLDAIVKEFETFLKGRQSKFKYADMNRTVASVVSVVEKEALYKGISMKVEMPHEPLNMNMQKDLLRVAIYHIIRNAIDATPPGGMVSVAASKEGDTIILAVSDTGYGISEENIENVFRPFFSTKERGFGLGLPLVKQIVSEHLGTLVFESKQGTGTTFKMTFPVRWKEEKFG